MKNILDNKYQAVYLLPTIDVILKENNFTLNNLDALVLSNGPGRFTGLRIATSCIQGLAYGLDKKIITINSLLLLALQFVADNFTLAVDPNKIVWVCQKAYHNVYYQAKYLLSDLLNLINLRNIDTSNLSKLTAELKLEIETENSNQNLSNYYFIGSIWHDIFSDLAFIGQAPIIYAEPINVQHCFNYANFEYFSNNLFFPYEVTPVYAVNPFSHVNTIS